MSTHRVTYPKMVINRCRMWSPAVTRITTLTNIITIQKSGYFPDRLFTTPGKWKAKKFLGKVNFLTPPHYLANIST